jgi:1,4-dihydroxy-2-naphthoyl-CoA synthase
MTHAVADEVLAHYAKVSGRQVDDIDYYCVLAKWKLAVVLEQGFQRAGDDEKLQAFGGGGGTFLGTRLPLGIALEITLTGDSIDAERAYALGLINAVVPPDDVLPRALEFADRIAANGPLGVAATKELVRLAVTDHARAHVRLAELQQSVFGSQDAKEGALAFVEKRAPVWQGR